MLARAEYKATSHPSPGSASDFWLALKHTSVLLVCSSSQSDRVITPEREAPLQCNKSLHNFWCPKDTALGVGGQRQLSFHITVCEYPERVRKNDDHPQSFIVLSRGIQLRQDVSRLYATFSLLLP